ncbi:hypothetical protein EDB89DRAFT_1905046 [Lactarius sanguifluus]|nr:hypothetical protein EDB89DRAFT_1905046 [Lactarius sanguifluus]
MSSESWTTVVVDGTSWAMVVVDRRHRRRNHGQVNLPVRAANDAELPTPGLHADRPAGSDTCTGNNTTTSNSKTATPWATRQRRGDTSQPRHRGAARRLRHNAVTQRPSTTTMRRHNYDTTQRPSTTTTGRHDNRTTSTDIDRKTPMATTTTGDRDDSSDGSGGPCCN